MSDFVVRILPKTELEGQDLDAERLWALLSFCWLQDLTLLSPSPLDHHVSGIVAERARRQSSHVSRFLSSSPPPCSEQVCFPFPFNNAPW